VVLIANDDRPGVIGDVGSALGRHGVNVASFALGRSDAGAVGVINVDASPKLDAAVDEIRKLPAIREAVVVRL
jgi:D-3-phosphoglycerate dehydrogenase